MEKQTYNIQINASTRKVWETLWGEESYRAWTAPFAEGSTVETDWQKGSKVLFTDGKGSGMVSVIREMIPNEYMSFEHLGCVKNGVEDLTNAETQTWAGGLENYTLADVDGKTDLTVDLSTKALPKEMVDYFANAWPKALACLKELAEKK